MLTSIKSFLFNITLMFGMYPLEPTVTGSMCNSRDSDFLEYRYKEQIPVCSRNVTPSRKDKICKRDGIINRKEFTVDHMIPLFAGGSNHDDNLWCQHKSISSADYEYSIFLKLRDNEIDQITAIDAIKDFKFHRGDELNEVSQ